MTKEIPEKESLTVEFKSDIKGLPANELVETVTCLANSEGGEIYLGVENDGEVTGLNAKHQDMTGLTAMIANKTNPPLIVRTERLNICGKKVAKISVPKCPRIVATSEGKLLRRRMMADGTPGCVPFYPHEFTQRQADLGLMDYSALPIVGTTPDAFDPIERERLRQMIERYGGDRSLLSLSDEELEGALGFSKREGGHRVPTIAGLLVLGREPALREHLPVHEVAFQVLEGTQVRVNDFYRSSLLNIFERVMQQFEARVEEDEIQVGLFRVPIPTFEKRSFREAFINAITHRDYTRLGAIHVRLETDGLVISNPGGFVEGVSLDNLLVVEPKPRNPLLADVFKRIGLAERTGRGVDLIYQGLLRYGRPEPDYSQSDRFTVTVRLSSASADTPFLKMILEAEEQLGTPMPIDALILLARLRIERRLDISRLSKAIQKDDSTTRSILERLTESGLMEAHGAGKGRTYMLSAKVYSKMGQQTDYVRQAGFDAIQQRQMVLQFVHKHGHIARKDVIDLCKINQYQATRLLNKLVAAGELERLGKGRSTHYAPSTTGK